jgi:hypothetical protein
MDVEGIRERRLTTRRLLREERSEESSGGAPAGPDTWDSDGCDAWVSNGRWRLSRERGETGRAGGNFSSSYTRFPYRQRIAEVSQAYQYFFSFFKMKNRQDTYQAVSGQYLILIR